MSAVQSSSSSSTDPVPPDVQKLLDSAAQSSRPKSWKKYEIAYDKYEDWCHEVKINPVSVTSILAYFSKCVQDQTKSASTCLVELSFVKSVISERVGKLFTSQELKKVYNYLNKQRAHQGVNKAKTFSSEDIIELFEFHLKENSRTNVMLRLMFLLSVGGMLRSCQLHDLTWKDIQDKDDILQISVYNVKQNLKSKDPQQEKRLVTYKIFSDPLYCPVNNLCLYSDFLEEDGVKISGSLFKGLRGKELPRNSDTFVVDSSKKSQAKSARFMNANMGLHTLQQLTKKLAQLLGKPDWDEYTSHSMRRTGATLG
ncbi:MAG: hypothetical protein ACRDF4_01005, partial [Rhabdochlamydiaceae bacterium]